MTTAHRRTPSRPALARAGIGLVATAVVLAGWLSVARPPLRDARRPGPGPGPGPGPVAGAAPDHAPGDGPRAVGGATAAAVAFVAATDRLAAASPIGRRELLRTLLTRAAYPREAAELETALEALGARLRSPDGAEVDPARLVWVEAPLRARVEAAGADRARAELWTLSVFGAPELGPARAAWRTVRLELVAERGRWLVDDVRAEPGPAPVTDDLVLPDGFARFAEAASWPSIVGG